VGIIDFHNVSFKYLRSDKRALDGIDLSVNEGEFLAVMGENGSGKTTFCRLINGVIPHSCAGSLSGSVIVDGVKINDSAVPSLALKVGMVLDDPDSQLFTSSVFDEAAFGPENFLLSREEVIERVKFALKAAGLDGFENRQPSTLSGGEKQRLSIAAALAMKSKILVLDEPLCRLDPDGALEVMSVLESLKTRHGITVVMASGESEIIAEYADRICVLNNGRIAAFDTAKKISSDAELLEKNGIQPVKSLKNFYANLTRLDLQSADERKTSPVPPVRRCQRQENPVIQIYDFSYNYKNADINIKNINLTIYENDFAAITGRNGCGKTTLLKNITGLLRPRGGEILIRGRNIKKLSIAEISAEAGFVMQNPDTQLFTESVYNEAAFALLNTRGEFRFRKRFSKSGISKHVNDALLKTGLEKNAEDYPHSLSRADRVMTVIACVLAMGCKIIIFDEADAGNDYPGNKKIMSIARELHSAGFTIIFVTHNMFLANEYAHRVIKMERDGIVSDLMIR